MYNDNIYNKNNSITYKHIIKKRTLRKFYIKWFIFYTCILLPISLAVLFYYNKMKIINKIYFDLEEQEGNKLRELIFSRGCFVPQQVNNFNDIEYFGKVDFIFDKLKMYLPYIHIINSMPNNEVKKIINAENMGTFLLGPPGTGKTLFVKKFCYELNCLLKYFDYKYKNNPDQIRHFNLQNIKLTHEQKQECQSYPNKVNLFVIRPSDLKFQWIGESEKAIKRLFDKIKTNIGSYEANVVFFDEAESLFSKRIMTSTSKTIISEMMSEFLNQLNNMTTNIQPIFFFAATNMEGSIDEAILRRFSKKIFFNNPVEQYRREFLMNLLVNSKLSFLEIEQLVALTENRSFSFLESLCLKFKKIDFEGNYIGFDFQSAKNYAINEIY